MTMADPTNRLSFHSNDDSSQESSDDTPQPSPEGYPKDTAYSAVLRGQARLSSPREHQYPAYSIDSEISLPKPPSPYSPPPASLFSGEDLHPLTRNRPHFMRPPLQEVHLQSPNHSRGMNIVPTDTFDDDDLDKNLSRFASQIPPTPLQMNMTTPMSTSSQRNLLPAILQLKHEAAEAHRSLFILQQEKSALSNVYGALKVRFEEDRQHFNSKIAMLQRSEMELREKLELSLKEQCSVQEKNKILSEQLDLLRQVQKDLENARKERDDAQNSFEKFQAARQASDDSHTQLREENERLSKALQLTNLRLQRAGSDHEELGREMEGLQIQVKELRGKLKGTSAESAKRVQTLKGELASVNQRHDKECSSLKLELDRLQALLTEENLIKKKLESDCDYHKAEIENLKKTFEAANKLHHASKADAARAVKMEKQIRRLDDDLRESQAQNAALRNERQVLRKRVDEQIHRCLVDVSCQTENQANKVDSASQTGPAQSLKNNSLRKCSAVLRTDSLVDRVERIRDTAERAALLQDHRREVARLASQHECRMAVLQAEHEEESRQVVRDAKSEVAKCRAEFKRRLKEELETKAMVLEQKYRADTDKDKDKFDSNLVATSDSLLAALSELTATQEQLEHEMSKRQQLEASIEELKRKSTSQALSRMQRPLSSWEQETRALLALLRADCNAAFDKRMPAPNTELVASGPGTVSPQSVMETDIERDLNSILGKLGSQKDSSSIGTSTESAGKLPTDLELALDETEALVRRLMVNEKS